MVVLRPALSVLIAFPVLLALACAPGGAGDSEDSEGDSEGDSGGDTADASTSDEPPDPSTWGAETDDASGSESEGDSDDMSGSTGEAPPELPDPELPVPTGACPDIVDGTLSFHPQGVATPRDVRVWIDEDAAKDADGPVIFYWHGTGSSPNEATYGLSAAGVNAFTQAGGAVVAASADPAAGTFPWYLVLTEQEDDLLIADEVLGCLDEQWGVDPRRIHAAGMSAGGLMTTQMSYRRSSYLASVAVYSGGIGVMGVPEHQDPENPFSAMIFHGGSDDVVVISFKLASETYLEDLLMKGHFAFICDHGLGHSIPVAAVPSALKFLSDHPYGTRPSPYEDGLPESFPDYCTL